MAIFLKIFDDDVCEFLDLFEIFASPLPEAGFLSAANVGFVAGRSARRFEKRPAREISETKPSKKNGSIPAFFDFEVFQI